IVSKIDLSGFSSLTSLSIINGTVFDLVSAKTFPSSLTSLDLSNNNISDPSPLYALSSSSLWDSIDLSNNAICEDGTDDALNVLNNIFTSSSPDIVISVGTQDCHCSTDNPSLSDNKVCGETKPGSGVWYVVCASDSYTSYTSAVDFSCTQPDSSTMNCSGGCEYGYECRYLGDEVIGGVSYTTGECQQVIVDENLHDCVADMFGANDYLHRTDSTPSLFTVASLKTLAGSFDNTSKEYSLSLTCSNVVISELSGIEHVGNVLEIILENTSLPNSSLSNISTLDNLESLNISYNSSLTSLPDFSGFPLKYLDISSTNISLSSSTNVSSLLPTSIRSLRMYDTPTDQAGFDIHVCADHLQNLKTLVIGNTTAISSISVVSSSLTTLGIGDTSSSFDIVDLQSKLDSMSSLQTVILKNIDLTSIPDLSSSKDSLTSLILSNNGEIPSVYPLAAQGLSQLVTFNCNDCSISDLSPMYSLPNLMTISVVGNNICMGSESTEDLGSKFHNYGEAGFILDLGSDLATDQTCDSTGCSSIAYTSDSSCTPITDNLVCSETKPGSGVWYVVCASDSYTSYTSAEDFSCTQPDSSTTNCSGGCEYGYECRYLGDEVIGGVSYTTGECQQVIVDDNLHACVADMFVDSVGDPDYTHRTSTSPSLFSVASLRTISSSTLSNVASLRTISTSTLSNDGFSLSNFDRFSLLDGIEHIRSLTSISLPYHNFVNADPLGSLHGLESLSLAHNMYGAPVDADGNVIEGFSDLSFICSLHSLSTLALSSVTSVSALPDISECADTYTSLSSLNLAETSIIDVSALLVAADSTNVSLTELIMNGAALYDDVAETTSLFDPSILV
ncbi:hypothetical protein ADUPG1_010351, partial [Aduncisulcus paluster]